MKSIRRFFSLFIAILCFMLCVSGCDSKQETESLITNSVQETESLITNSVQETESLMTNSVQETESLTANSESNGNAEPEPEHRDPPFELTFLSWSEYQEFGSMTEKTDSEIEAYLKESHFISNGMRDRKDIAKYKDIIDSLYIIRPKADSFKMYTMIFYIDYGYLLITYADGVDSTSLSYDDCFYCYAWPDANDNAPTPESDLSIMIDDCTFYRVKENPKMFLGIVDNQTIGIEYWGNDLQNASEMLQNCFEIKKISDIFQDEK